MSTNKRIGDSLSGEPVTEQKSIFSSVAAQNFYMPSNASLQNNPLRATCQGYGHFMNNTGMFPAILLPLSANLLVCHLPGFFPPRNYCRNYRCSKGGIRIRPRKNTLLGKGVFAVVEYWQKKTWQGTCYSGLEGRSNSPIKEMMPSATGRRYQRRT